MSDATGTPSFLQGGGVMGELVRRFDWAATSLGPPAQWQQSLKTAVSLLLRARQPTFIGWGRDFISIYNDGYVPICGSKHPGALGRPMAEVWAEIWPELLPLNEAVMRGEALLFENRPFDLGGRAEAGKSWFTFSYTPLLDDDGQVAGIFCSAIETTSTIRLERARSEQTLRQRRMFEQAPGFICTLHGPDHVFDFVNAAYVRLFGRTELVGRTVREVFPELEGQGYYERLDHVYATGERYVAGAVPARIRHPATSQEQERDLLLSFVYAPIYDEDGRISGVFCEGQDVTEMHAMQEALREGDRHKDEFIATLAHELRNPLAPLSNGLHILRSRTTDDPSVRVLDMMQRQLANLVRLVDDLLEISRISRGTLELRAQPMPLADAVRAACEASEPLLRERRHEFVVDSVDRSLWVHGDLVRLTQLFGNLLNNAAHYTPAGGKVRLEVERTEGSAVIRVVDTGQGFKPEERERIFGMFARGDRSGGLGIGLALGRRLATMHGGSLTAESAGPGLGAVFTVSLPLCAPPAGSGGESAGENAGTQQALNVLIVDDNVDAGDSLALLLRELGATVAIARSGHEALAAFERVRPVVVLLDIGMPGMDGYEVARLLRSRFDRDRFSIVGLSGWGQERDRALGKKAGFDHHLVKPADIAALQAVLRAGASGTA